MLNGKNDSEATIALRAIGDERERIMAEPLRHRQTKEAATDMFYLKPPRHISTLPKTEVVLHERPFRLTPVNGHRYAALACQKSADIVAKVENRTALKISRKLNFGLLCCCVAFQRHYGDP
jgi:hypothetical protein